MEFAFFLDMGHLAFLTTQVESHPGWTTTSNIVFFNMTSNLTQDKRFPITDDLLIRHTEGSSSFLQFIAIDSPVGPFSTVWLNMIDYDPDFQSFSFPNFRRTQAIGISSNNQALVGYNAELGELKLALIDFELEADDYYHYPVINDVTIIDLPEDYLASVDRLFVLDNEFIMQTNFGSFHIDEAGQLTSLDIWLYQVFEQNNALYALGRNFMIEDFIYTSYDNGRTWNELAPFNNTSIYNTVLHKKADGLVLSNSDQIFSFELVANQIQLKEYDNTSLEGKLITSVSEYNDSIYVSSFSGVYRKHVEEFY